MRNSTRRADILIRIPLDMLAAMDDAANVLHVSRVAFIPQAISRNLIHFIQHEKPIIEQIYRQEHASSQA